MSISIVKLNFQTLKSLKYYFAPAFPSLCTILANPPYLKTLNMLDQLTGTQVQVKLLWQRIYPTLCTNAIISSKKLSGHSIMGMLIQLIACALSKQREQENKNMKMASAIMTFKHSDTTLLCQLLQSLEVRNVSVCESFQPLLHRITSNSHQ